MFSNKVLATYKFTYPAKIIYLEDVKQKFTQICRENNFSYRDLNNIIVVIDEVCANIIKHAYSESEGDMEFEVTIREKGMYLTVIDHGKSFNWHAFKTPNLNQYVSVGKKGGLGLWIIRKLTDKSDYKVTERGNELHLVKYYTKPSIAKRIVSFLIAKGIKEKFIVGTSILIFILILGVYAYFIRHERASLKEKFITYNVELIKSIAGSSSDRIIKGNYLGLIKLLNEIKNNNDNINEIFILDSNKTVIAHNDPENLYKKYERKSEILEMQNIKGINVLKLKKGNNYEYDINGPIKFAERLIGEIHLVISKKSIDKVMSSKKINIIVATILVLLIYIIGIYLLMEMIIKPLEILRQGVIAIGEGRLEHRIEIEGEDEFSQIAKAFNEMALKFKGVQQSLLEQEKLQREIQVAKEIQHTLLPKHIPKAEGFDIASLYRSAKEVGGDYYDILDVGKNLIGVIVADVSGKGVPGSLVMTITRTAVRLISYENKSAKNVLVKVNNFIKEDMKKGMFVTAFYLVLDSFTRTINFASAGHDPLILYRAKENKVYYVKPKGFPLGISLPDDDLFRKVMVEERIKLEKDDMLVVYTDGVTEAMNGKRELFTEKRFVEFIKANGKLSPTEFIEKLDNEIKEFTQGYPQSDDITIVAIKEKKTDTSIIKTIENKIKKLKEKRMKVKDIEKELGISMDVLKQIKEEKKIRQKPKIGFLTFELKKELMNMIINNPDWGITKYAEELSAKYSIEINEKLVQNELKRVNLLTKEARLKYSQERKT
jgi:serine phosphatase RsbU (regulator of sigma subunit)/anti-sigma regulatory factor (Ser/Thr protein kinase)